MTKKIDWKKRARAAEERLAEVTAPKPTGRRPAPPRTTDGKLIALAVKALGCTRGQLAERVSKALGEPFAQSRLTAANRPKEEGGWPLTDAQKTAIDRLITEANRKSHG